ncbi:MAG TPA: hypothetical protein VGN37_11035 [Actinocatenispora sp.]
MSGTPRSDDASAVDIDLLADYQAGVLAGTPDEARVADLVASHPEWAAAARALTAADRAVRGDLTGLAAEPAPMPPDVLAGLVDAIRAERPAAGPVVAFDAARRRKVRRARWALGAAAAVVVVALLGLVGTSVLRQNSAPESSSAKATGAPDDSGQHPDLAPNGAAPGAATLSLTASGTDYTPATLPSVVRATGSPSLGAATRAGVPAELSRLTRTDQLDGCLDAVGVESVGTAKLVDYARFRGKPAAVIWLAQKGASGTIVAVGPDCGETGPDVLYQAVVLGTRQTTPR